MDLALVLASQEIPHAILRDPETQRWVIEVDARDYDGAVRNIRRYQEENRRWKWRPQEVAGRFRFDAGAMFFCLFLATVHWLVTQPAPGLQDVGIMDSEKFAAGDWWRIVTAVTLHADWRHLASNVMTGFVLFGVAMGRFGPGLGLLGAWLAGIGGNLFAYAVYDGPYRGLGASGMVLGALGLVATDSLSYWKANPWAWKRLLAGFAGACLLFILLGTDPSSDLAAHAGGFLCGCVLGLGLVLLRIPEQLKESVDISCLILFVGGVYGSWLIAMRSIM